MLYCIYNAFLFAVLLLVSVILLGKKYKAPIFGVYQQPNQFYWFKFIFMYVTLVSRKLCNQFKTLRNEEILTDNGTFESRVSEEEEKLEQKYDLGSFSKSIDAVYFNGFSKEGQAIICGVARRPNSVCDAFVYLKVDEGNLFLSPALPDTYLEQAQDEEGHYFVQGIKIEKFKAMKSWNVSYKGNMKSNKEIGKFVEVEISLIWHALWPAFNFDSHMSACSMAQDLAREPWTREYFELLKSFHQTHYEQMGAIKGDVTVDGKKYHLDMPCVRDHSFGKLREWRTFHRYVLHFIYLSNGDCMAVGCVSQPVILSHLTIGYVCHKKDNIVSAVTSSDFKLYHHGEDGLLPANYAFVFHAGGEMYNIKVNVKTEEIFYIGKERQARFYERWCDVEVNGLKGVACSEWQYNNTITK